MYLCLSSGLYTASTVLLGKSYVPSPVFIPSQTAFQLAGSSPYTLVTSLIMLVYCSELAILGNRVGCPIPTFKSYESVGLPDLPCLVVIKITPLPAREPYIAAEASFNTDTLSTSFGFIRSIPPALCGTPSITIKGSLFPPDRELIPRIRILEPS